MPVLTPWSRILLEKLTVIQLVNKFAVIYRTRRFIIAFTLFSVLIQMLLVLFPLDPFYYYLPIYA